MADKDSQGCLKLLIENQLLTQQLLIERNEVKYVLNQHLAKIVS